MPGNFYSETPADELRRVKAEILARGIVCSKQSHDGRKELFRDGRSLGFFTAYAACQRFIEGYAL